jgi:hypothetical protein
MKSRLHDLRSLIFILIVLLLAFRGWASSRDIESRAFVLMQGVDTAPDNAFAVTYSIAASQELGNEGGGTSGKEAVVIKKARCKNLWQGHHSIQSQLMAKSKDINPPQNTPKVVTAYWGKLEPGNRRPMAV